MLDGKPIKAQAQPKPLCSLCPTERYVSATFADWRGRRKRFRVARPITFDAEGRQILRDRGRR